jgi:hypothetical protein
MLSRPCEMTKNRCPDARPPLPPYYELNQERARWWLCPDAPGGGRGWSAGPSPADPCYGANLNTRGRGSQGSSNRLDPSDGCGCRKEHRKKVRLIRPRQSEAEAGNQRDYSEFPYVGVQSLLSPLPRTQVSFELNEPRGAKCGTTSCRRRAASTLSARSISRPQIKVTADEVRSFLPYLGQTRNDAPSAL